MGTWRDTLGIALLAAVAYALLRQDAVHHLDMHGVVRSVAAPAGEGARYGHFGYQWLAWCLHALLGPDAPLYRPLQWCSVVAAALAVGAGHRACLASGLGRGPAAAAALGAGATGVAVFFATIAEIHAVFWLPVNLAWWSLAGCLRAPSLARGARTGALLGLAAAVHSSGHLLPLLGLLAALAVVYSQRRDWRSRAAAMLAVWLGHALVFGLLRGVDRALFAFADEAAAQGFLRETLARWQGFAALPGLLWREIVLPYLPFVVLVPVVALHRAARPLAVALAIGFAGYLAIDLSLLIGLVERGAYALPLAVPAAALVAWRLGAGKAWLAALAAALVTAFAMPRWHDPARVPEPEFARGLASWATAQPGATFVLGGYAEIDSLLVHGAPRWHHTILEPEFVVWLQPGTPDRQVRAALTERVRRAAASGGALVLSREAAALFGSLPRNLAILVAPDDELEVQDVAAGAFGGLAITIRRGG